MESWNVEKAIDFYGVDRWGLGYFTVNEAGNICVKPSAESPFKVDIKLMVDELRKRNIHTPVLIRVMDILKDRLHTLTDCFKKAIKDNDYKGNYYPLFPIKVNQERDVVTSFLRYGKDFGVGLEAGSKAELMIVLSLTQFPETPIVCNGYKDPEFVRLVCLAHKIGKRVFPVIENYGEVETFIAHYHKTGIMPNLGVRIKLATKGVGKWAESGGDSSKFGLRINEVMEAVRLLHKEGLLGSLKLLHFHIGSQVSQISVVKQAVLESMRVFTELVRLGAELEYLDIGGGLGVDYEGAPTEGHINYSTAEYASDIVYRVKQACDQYGIKHPTLFSESGRFVAAHYSLLITDVPACNSVLSASTEVKRPEQEFGPVKEMFDIINNLNDANVAECYHDALEYKSEALNMFNLGFLSLPERGNMEQIFWTIMEKIVKKKHLLPQQEREDLAFQMADMYFANFSLFQSLPDSWAIDQLFPIIPIHRLDEEPDRSGVIADLTCDSDGVIDNYPCDEEMNKTVALHQLQPGIPYYLGVFLVGAYQETLGELHNLFGDPHAVQVELLGENQYKIRNLIKGDTVNQVISYVSYDTEKLTRRMREQLERAVEERLIDLDEAAHFMSEYEEGMAGYTYFED